MPVIVGNLLTDPTAQSFISLADAVAYLEPEAAVAGAGSPLSLFMAADAPMQEGALVRTSRWLAGSFRWQVLDDAALLRVGYVAARLAAETFGRETFAGVDPSAAVKREKVDVIETEYFEPGATDTAGLSFDWLRPMLFGLIEADRGSRTKVRWLGRA